MMEIKWRLTNVRFQTMIRPTSANGQCLSALMHLEVQSGCLSFFARGYVRSQLCLSSATEAVPGSIKHRANRFITS
ncbi:hypothetical protein HZ326_2884 [Fusarium oxysporum f. sp. albedinis]|nr:hypothetical protein HZ326_2884 [Fusarium oxysporum f. sp. albedinis]